MNKSVKQVRTKGKFNSEKSQEWQQERQERIGQLVKQLEEGVATIQSSEDFKRWLTVVSRFHTYSPNNQLLIMLQYPTATRVAGYRTWQSLGRQVKRGEKGISILAPRPFERVVEDQASGTEEVLKGISFRTVSVFDISQTEGEALPEIAPGQLQGEEGTELYLALANQARTEGIKITSFDRMTGGDDSQSQYNGYYLPEQSIIFVKQAATSQMVKTLAHELAHHYDPAREGSRREESETVAEAAAFIVTSYYGLDTTAYSFPYVAGWAGKKEGAEVIKAVMSRIQQAAHRILALLQGEGEGSEAVERA